MLQWSRKAARRGLILNETGRTCLLRWPVAPAGKKVQTTNNVVGIIGQRGIDEVDQHWVCGKRVSPHLAATITAQILVMTTGGNGAPLPC